MANRHNCLNTSKFDTIWRLVLSEVASSGLAVAIWFELVIGRKFSIVNVCNVTDLQTIRGSIWFVTA